MGLFGKPHVKAPRELVKEWSTKIRQEGRHLDREIRGIQREEEKVKKSLKEAAKKGDREVCVVLAKGLIRSKKAITKIYSAKAQLKSVEHSISQQAALVRMSGVLQKSTEVMQSMQQLVSVSEISGTMRELSKEMMKAGIIEEMTDDMFASTMDDDELDEEATEEVDKILWEITAGHLGKAPAAVEDSLPVLEPEGATASVEEDEEDVSKMQARLEALRS
ncbi:Charged multivesicular body protein 3 [Lamellibrachia satsuma]|nr:Charged multivesicular body protein 3 [Lamellibrachia satsuma]